MSDYTCKCQGGPFGSPRYTVADAVRMNHHCLRCKSNLVIADPIESVFDNTDDDLDDNVIAPGANALDSNIREILERENTKKKIGELMDDIERHQNSPIGFNEPNDEPDPDNDDAKLGHRMTAGEMAFVDMAAYIQKMQNSLDVPDVRLRYAHGIVYEFEFDEIEFDGDFVTELVEWMDPKRKRIIDFKYRGRRYILNSELCGGVDFRV